MGELNFFLNGPGHMTNVAAMPIYAKNLKKNFFSGTKRPMTLKVDMRHRYPSTTKFFQMMNPGLALTYFTARSNLVPYAFV